MIDRSWTDPSNFNQGPPPTIQILNGNRELLLKISLACILLLLLFQSLRHMYGPTRISAIPQSEERILVFGAGTGIGRDIAIRYLKRGARVCIVGRRQDKLDDVAKECRMHGDKLLSVAGDVSSIDDMIALRAMIQKEWNGLDTLILCAGVSALQPILGLAGVENPDLLSELRDIDGAGIKKALSVAQMATRINYFGTLVVAVTFIPLLSRSSRSPSILLLSSLAATVPSPTRALYGSTKAASLVLCQALSSEHPSITFTCVLPSTVQGAFRASAVDNGVVREKDPNLHGIPVEAVAKRCVQAIDNREHTVFIPVLQGIGPFLYFMWPWIITEITKKKYNYFPTV